MSKCVVTWVLVVLPLVHHPLPAQTVSPEEAKATKHVRVFVEGDSSVIPKFIKLA